MLSIQGAELVLKPSYTHWQLPPMRLCLQNVPERFQTVAPSVDKGSSIRACGGIFYIQTLESIWWKKFLFGVTFKSMDDYNLFLVVPWKILDSSFVLCSLHPPAKVLHSFVSLIAELPLCLQASCSISSDLIQYVNHFIQEQNSSRSLLMLVFVLLARTHDLSNWREARKLKAWFFSVHSWKRYA